MPKLWVVKLLKLNIEKSWFDYHDTRCCTLAIQYVLPKCLPGPNLQICFMKNSVYTSLLGSLHGTLNSNLLQNIRFNTIYNHYFLLGSHQKSEIISNSIMTFFTRCQIMDSITKCVSLVEESNLILEFLYIHWCSGPQCGTAHGGRHRE